MTFRLALAATVTCMLLASTASAARFRRGPSSDEVPPDNAAAQTDGVAATKVAGDDRVAVTVQVHNSLGLALRDITIRVNGKIIGETNSHGVLAAKVDAAIGTMKIAVDTPDGYAIANGRTGVFNAKVAADGEPVELSVVLESDDASAF